MILKKGEMEQNTCEFCASTYPMFDSTVQYYSVNVFGIDRIICNECKSRLRKIRKLKGGKTND